MIKNICCSGRFLRIIFTILVSFGVTSCVADSHHSSPHSGVTAPPQMISPTIGPVRTVAVIDFSIPEASSVEKGRVATDEITGFTIVHGSIQEHAGNIVSDHARVELSDLGFVVLPDETVAEALKDENQKEGLLSVASKVGKSIGADLVFIGSVYRYEERAGGRFSVDKPASVAFTLAAISPADSKVVWKAKFDKTQKSLLEDLREIGTFFKGGMVWQSAIQFSSLGMEETLKRFPIRPGGAATPR